ncbi:MAG: GntR family transcriptional regulator [Deltaproteobacteria bacterium]|jgi:GntR family transcriptional repressor for pyruvate dehydrogenase complex
MGRFKPIRQFRISEEVLSQLKESILLGKFKSGEKLPSERELTEEFQVSRGVIREAIRILEITGFVTLRQGPTGGAFVTDLSFDHVGNAFLDLFLSNKVSIPELANVRLFVEPEVGGLAALNATEEDRKRLTEAQEGEFLSVSTTTARIIQFQRVHHVIAESCQNHFYEAISKSMLRLTFEVVEAVDPDHEALHMPGEHKHIIDAIINANAEAARAAMQTHMEKFCKSLLEMETAYRRKALMAV